MGSIVRQKGTYFDTTMVSSRNVERFWVYAENKAQNKDFDQKFFAKL